MECISPGTFKKDLSNWRKNKDLPSFEKIVVLSEFSQKPEEKFFILIQMLIARALLRLKYKYDIDKSIEKEFLKTNDTNEIRNKYSFDFSKIMKSPDILSILPQARYLLENLKLFIQNNPEIDRSISTKAPHEINCMFKDKEYMQVIKNIDKTIKSLNYIERYSYMLVQFIASLKIGDDKLIRKYLKLFHLQMRIISYFG
ncbi:MAG: hypothetical protein LBI78_07080 [Campylobacteraceae bacterium]|nr:hypothetical protein [Campylobacteraceae bacterium]